MRQAEFVVEEPYAAYPEKHSVWDKLKVPTGSMTLEAGPSSELVTELSEYPKGLIITNPE